MFRNKKSIIDEANISTARLEALTDSIFAVAMTLLILDVHLPVITGTISSDSLWQGLLAILPKLLSFAISFIILGMFWVAHHTEFHYIEKLDHKIIWLNIFYLLFVCAVPFSAGLLGSYADNQVAIIVYGFNLMILVLIHFAMWQHASEHKDLMVKDLDVRINKLVSRMTFFAVVGYLAAILFSFWSREAALIIYAIVPLPYIFGWTYKLV